MPKSTDLIVQPFFIMSMFLFVFMGVILPVIMTVPRHVEGNVTSVSHSQFILHLTTVQFQDGYSVTFYGILDVPLGFREFDLSWGYISHTLVSWK